MNEKISSNENKKIIFIKKNRTNSNNHLSVISKESIGKILFNLFRN
jgi:hypothetical protein